MNLKTKTANTINELSDAPLCAGKLFYWVNWLLGEILYTLSYYFLKLQATFSTYRTPILNKVINTVQNYLFVFGEYKKKTGF